MQDLFFRSATRVLQKQRYDLPSASFLAFFGEGCRKKGRTFCPAPFCKSQNRECSEARMLRYCFGVTRSCRARAAISASLPLLSWKGNARKTPFRPQSNKGNNRRLLSSDAERRFSVCRRSEGRSCLKETRATESFASLIFLVKKRLAVPRSGSAGDSHAKRFPFALKYLSGCQRK